MRLQRFIFLIISIYLCMPATGKAQIEFEVLRNAALEKDCSGLKGMIDPADSEDDRYKFFSAICLYLNGDVAQSKQTFLDLESLANPLHDNVLYWLAKINAGQGVKDSALFYLSMIPEDKLNPIMLDAIEFDEMRMFPEFITLRKIAGPGFNFFTGLLTFITIIGYLLFFYFVFARKLGVGRLWMALLVLSFSIILTCYNLSWTKYSYYFTAFNNVWQSCIYFIGPSVYFYLHYVFKRDISNGDYWKHFSLPVICFICMLPLILMGYGDAGFFFREVYRMGASPYLMVSHLVFYSVMVKQMENNDWNVDTNIKQWTLFLSIGLMVFTLAMLSYYMLVNTTFFNPNWDYSISLVMCLGILLIAYMGIIQGRIFKSEPIRNFLPVIKYKYSPLSDLSKQRLLDKLNRLLIEGQVFKENELRLDDLAGYMDITRHQLSQLINEEFGVNFFEFINSYRVEHVKKLLQLKEYNHYTIQQIAFEAGFNNKASFNRYFKREVGLTPSAYRMKVES